MAALGTVWHTAVKREKERELLFVGDQYRRAIESFWQASPKGQERLPKNFDELLKDPRFPDTRRHLRRAYRDPITGQVAWGLVKAPDGGIAGVYSLSEAESMKVANFPPGYESFETVPSYRQWVFQFSVQGTSSEGGAGTGQGGTQGAANNAGGTADTQQPSTQKVPYDPMAWLDKVYQCEMVKQAAYQACLPYHSSGNQTAWKSCTAEVSSNYAACING
ncbi:MAG: type II secretion system protein [Hydrogenophilaceae bacterium]|nr:type II secretion system protein [Hydrogenophilaceae bacterium]